jgi:hypothetical protein
MADLVSPGKLALLLTSSVPVLPHTFAFRGNRVMGFVIHWVSARTHFAGRRRFVQLNVSRPMKNLVQEHKEARAVPGPLARLGWSPNMLYMCLIMKQLKQLTEL